MKGLSVQARAFVHATEDEDRVREAMLWILGLLGRPEAQHRVERRRLKGHYGNDILHLVVGLKGAEDAEGPLGRLVEDAAFAQALAQTLAKRLDEDGFLHVRFDKQAAVQRRLALTEGGDAVVVQFKGSVYRPDTPLKAWHAFLAASG